MKLTNVGGATAILEHAGKRILFDPWLNDGILYGSWYHYPPLKMGIEDLGRFDYIYISHIHEDHCAAGTIQHLNRDAEIIVMDREPKIPNFVAKFLSTYGFNFRKVHRIKPYTPVELEPGLTVDMVEADPQHEYNFLIDSGLVLKWDGFTLYNANDCGPYPGGLDYIKSKYGHVDLALLPYSGGSGYPACYTNLSHHDKLGEKKRIFDSAISDFVDTVRTLDPKRVMPFADQYVIVGSNYARNRYSAHPPCPGYCGEPLDEAGLGDKLLLLNSGQAFDFDQKRKTPDSPYQMFSEADRTAYAESLKDQKYVHEEFEFNFGVPLDRLLTAARARMWDKQEKLKYFPECRLYLDVPDRQQRFEIDFGSKIVTQHKIDDANSLKAPYVRMTTSSTLLIMMLLNHVSWNMADGSLFLDYERVPNTYDPKFYAFMNYLIV